MAALADRRSEPLLIARPPVEPELLHDQRAFAWEILRRRADYSAYAAIAAPQRQYRAFGAVEVTSGGMPASAWGLG